VRELPDGKLAIEDCSTRRQSVYEKGELLDLIWSGRMTVMDGVGRQGAGRVVAPSIEVLADLKPAVRKEVERRLAYVTGLDKAHVSRGMRPRIGNVIATVAARIGDSKTPSTSTVMDWARRLNAADGYAGALLDRRAIRKSGTALCPVMEQIVTKTIQREYLTRDRKSLVHTLAMIRAEAERMVRTGKLAEDRSGVSLATLSRRVAAIDRYRVIEARQGPARARMVCRTSMDGAAAEYPLQRVEVDHTPLNWVVICERTGLPLGRPLLTVFVDAYSGYVLGFYVSFYGAGLTSVSGALRCAIRVKDDMTRGLSLTNKWLASGIPDHLVLDNGLEFHSPIFQLMGWELGTSFTYCRVRTPWLKPHVERFFSTLDTITLAKGRIHKRIANVVELDPIKGAAVMFSDFVRGIVQFVVDVHPFLINQRKLARPYDLFAEGLERRPPVQFPPDMEALRRASALSARLTVAQGGVELRGLPYGGDEVLPMCKCVGEPFKTLVKWDPDDLSQIWIQDPATKQWIGSGCRWAEYARGLSWNQHLTIRKFAMQEFKRCDALGYLERARIQMHNFWLDKVAWKTRADRKLAATMAGCTSARVLDGQEVPTVTGEAGPATVHLPASVPLCTEDFETVDMY